MQNLQCAVLAVVAWALLFLANAPTRGVPGQLQNPVFMQVPGNVAAVEPVAVASTAVATVEETTIKEVCGGSDDDSLFVSDVLWRQAHAMLTTTRSRGYGRLVSTAAGGEPA